MSRISQFQKYSQKENAVTNNVLLMLSRLNDIKTEYYKNFIQRVSEIEDYLPSPNFNQQVGITKGIIDGYIEVKASQIVIETKLNAKEWMDKLIKYADIFSHGQNFLWHLSKQKYNQQEEKKINDELKNRYKDKEIYFKNLSFEDLLENLESIYQENEYDENLKLLVNDFSNYCYEEKLINDDKYKLLFVPVGKSFDWNYKHKMYYCPESWNKQPFNYFGMYTNKAIRAITEIENVIVVNHNGTEIEIHHSTTGKEITEEQKERLRNALNPEDWMTNNFKIYLFDEKAFCETEFKKISKGGIQGHRYMNLKEKLGEENIKDKNTKEIAEMLKKEKWQ